MSGRARQMGRQTGVSAFISLSLVPHVFFRETRLIVHEKPNSQSYASFTIYRTGDLSGVTNVSCRLAPNKQNNATGDRDYSYKDLSNIISFSVGQSEAKGQIRIFSDGDKEGIEVFYVSMKKPYNGHISGTGELEVVILDVVEGESSISINNATNSLPTRVVTMHIYIIVTVCSVSGCIP